MTLHTIIIAKQPLPGFAKTRLIPALGPEGAAQLAEKMLQRAVASAINAELGPVTLNFTPSDWVPSESFIAHTALAYLPQVEGDLGQRMRAACESLCADGNRAILLMGTDCPELGSQILRQMQQALAEYDACIVPANDGGYVALAMRVFNASLFTGIAWSTDRVADATRSRMRQLNWRWLELPALVDIDEAEDLPYLPQCLQPVNS